MKATKKLTCLGIESTAHTFGIGIIKDENILVNVKDSYSTKHGGIIPNEAAKHHELVKEKVLQQALNESSLKLNDIDIISYSNAPGLAPCLKQGLVFAKELALKIKKPLVPVNHCIAHLEIGRLTGAKDPVLLYCSGANTQVISYAAGKYRVFGETLDIGVGNFIDSFARHAGLGFPGGPKIMNLARKSKERKKKGKNFISLPYSVKGMDVAFSGLLTNLKQKLDSGKYKLGDLSFSLQETAFAMLVEVAERAIAHLRKKELLLGGGVACNTRLQEMCKIMCQERGAKFFCPSNDLLLDNGAMIAFLGILMYKSGNKISVDKADFDARERTDDVFVNWK